MAAVPPLLPSRRSSSKWYTPSTTFQEFFGQPIANTLRTMRPLFSRPLVPRRRRRRCIPPPTLPKSSEASNTGWTRFPRPPRLATPGGPLCAAPADGKTCDPFSLGLWFPVADAEHLPPLHPASHASLVLRGQQHRVDTLPSSSAASNTGWTTMCRSCRRKDFLLLLVPASMSQRICRRCGNHRSNHLAATFLPVHDHHDDNAIYYDHSLDRLTSNYVHRNILDNAWTWIHHSTSTT